ncbi:hypothetical protein V6N13_060095 [Hibiscus sabdariffa]
MSTNGFFPKHIALATSSTLLQCSSPKTKQWIEWSLRRSLMMIPVKLPPSSWFEDELDWRSVLNGDSTLIRRLGLRKLLSRPQPR